MIADIDENELDKNEKELIQDTSKINDGEDEEKDDSFELKDWDI